MSNLARNRIPYGTKLAVVSTHPIQYYAPIFRSLANAESIDLRVFYTWSQAEAGFVHDRGFSREIAWDIPLLDGYEYEFVPNVAKVAGSDRFFGIRNPTLIASIEKWGANAVLVFGWNLYAHLQVMRHFHRRIPVFFRGDSTLLDDRSAMRTLFRKMVLGWVYRHVDVALAVGQNSADYFRWCGIAANRVSIAPHAVDNHRFSDPAGNFAVEATALRRQLAISEDAVVILFAAKMIPVKEPQLLVDAFRKCSAGHLVMVGNGPLDEGVRRWTAGHSRIHLLPFQNQAVMPAIYRMGDVFVMPSRSETWGLALNEAMASGRPVIASSRVGAARDLLRENINGWTFPSGNGDALAKLLQRVTSLQRSELHAMGTIAKNTIQDSSPEESARRIMVEVEQHRIVPRVHTQSKRAITSQGAN